MSLSTLLCLHLPSVMPLHSFFCETRTDRLLWVWKSSIWCQAPLPSQECLFYCLPHFSCQVYALHLREAVVFAQNVPNEAIFYATCLPHRSPRTRHQKRGWLLSRLHVSSPLRLDSSPPACPFPYSIAWWSSCFQALLLGWSGSTPAFWPSSSSLLDFDTQDWHLPFPEYSCRRTVFKTASRCCMMSFPSVGFRCWESVERGRFCIRYVSLLFGQLVRKCRCGL